MSRQLALPIIDAPRCNPDEAPTGYYAIRKSACDHSSGNLCRQCDWRPECQKEDTDFLAYGHRCMDYEIVAFRDGKTYQREDRCSVVFKRGGGAPC